jgi:hypothetical protein
MAQMVEHLPSKGKALSSKKKKDILCSWIRRLNIQDSNTPQSDLLIQHAPYQKIS